jgi:hypothetical protein
MDRRPDSIHEAFLHHPCRVGQQMGSARHWKRCQTGWARPLSVTSEPGAVYALRRGPANPSGKNGR